jgi:hypothetical protein
LRGDALEIYEIHGVLKFSQNGMSHMAFSKCNGFCYNDFAVMTVQ